MGKKLGQEIVIQSMTGLHRCDSSENRSSQIHIAQKVERFVADKLIIESQPFRIYDLVTIHKDGVIQRSTF